MDYPVTWGLQLRKSDAEDGAGYKKAQNQNNDSQW